MAMDVRTGLNYRSRQNGKYMLVHPKDGMFKDDSAAFVQQNVYMKNQVLVNVRKNDVLTSPRQCYGLKR